MTRSLSPLKTLLIALTCVVNWTSYCVAEDKPETLRVLCYNIHYGQGNDGEYNLERLAKVINDAKPDLVALQEVDVMVERSGKYHQVRKLSELTGLPARYGPTQHYQGGLFGNAILTKLPITDVLIQPLPYTESTPEKTTYPRGAIAVMLTTPAGKRLRFISTHFQHNMPEDRVAEAKAINYYFTIDSIPTILAGDLNATPDSEPISILNEQWENAMTPDQAPSAPSSNPRSRIDYIFYRGEISLKSTRVINEPMASDHCPVFAELILLK